MTYIRARNGVIFISVFTVLCFLFFCSTSDFTKGSENQTLTPQSRPDTSSKNKVYGTQRIPTDVKPKRSIEQIRIESDGQANSKQQYPANVNITLPNGATIERFFDVTGYGKLPRMTSKNVGEYLSMLETLTNEGNGAAAYELYGLLKRCSNSARSDTEYRAIEAAILSQESEKSPLSIDDQLLANKMTFLLCRNVTDDQLENKELLRSLALENNSLMALSNRARELLFDSPGQAGEIYKELWNRGHVTTGHALTYVYRITDFDGHDPSKPNLIKAHAYRLAKDIVDQQFLQNQGSIDLGNTLSQIDQGQAISAAMLSPQEQKEAEELAIQLLIDNESCCIDEWNFR